MFYNRQTPPRNSLKLIEFETCYNKRNPRLFFRQQNMQCSRFMVHSHFTLYLRARDYMKQLSQPMALRPLDESEVALTYNMPRIVHNY